MGRGVAWRHQKRLCSRLGKPLKSLKVILKLSQFVLAIMPCRGSPITSRNTNSAASLTAFPHRIILLRPVYLKEVFWHLSFFLVSINDLLSVTRNTFAVFADDSKYCNVIKRTNGCVSIQDEIGNWNLIAANAFHAKETLSDSIIKLDMKHYALLHDCRGSVVMDTGGCARQCLQKALPLSYNER